MPRLRNTRQERFAREIAALSPLATAYREAGYGGDPRWHPYNASKLANKSDVRVRIDELRLQFEQLSAIHVEYIRHQLLGIVEADVKELYEPDPKGGQRLRPISELPARLSRAIARVKIDPATGCR
jgi:phage terminase small subunit